tara:strand:- start:183 stop:338 length:156 start_codon:yes stop_codon:yes gene_type:complete
LTRVSKTLIERPDIIASKTVIKSSLLLIIIVIIVENIINGVERIDYILIDI